MKKRFLSRFSALIAVILFIMCPLDAYAAAGSMLPVIASASDAEEAPAEGVVLPHQDYDPLANLTEEQYAAYCQSFIDHPSILLDYPPGVPQPRFAVTLSAAAVWLLYTLAAAVGVVFLANFSQWAVGYDGYEFFSGFEMYMRVMHSGVDDFWAGWDAVMNATWGKAVSGMKVVYKYLKEYCTARVDGYGTDAPSYDINTSLVFSNSFSFIDRNGIKYPVTFPKDASIFACYYISSYVTGYGYYYKLIFLSFKAFTFTYGPNSFTGTSNVASVDGNAFYYFDLGFRGCTGLDDFLFLGERDESQLDEDYLSFLYTLLSDMSISTTISPDKSITDAQQKEFVSPADTITLPADQAAAEALAGQVSAATDAAGVAGALTGTWELGNTQEGEKEEDPVLPWLPDITGWLERLGQGIDAIRSGISSIPETLTNILDGILAIPGQVADFFTIDSAAISVSYASLQEAFAGRFSGISQLASVFQQSYNFETVYPVITVPVPEELREMFAGKTELVILDLNPFAEHFVYVRGLLIAMLYVAFAFWFLDEFDVKVHIG